jgi:hypothetical protein
MALIVKDRVLETCSTSGLVDFTLTGAVTGYQRFSAIGNGNTTYYAAYVIGSNDWEVGIGTVGTSSLTRDTILSSSTGSKVNFASNPVVWCDLPSSKAIFGDANNNISVNSIFEGFTSVGASGTQIVLTASSTPYYLVTGSGGQTIKLPDATTLPVGAVFDFNNNQSSGAISVNNNSNTLVASIPSGGYTSVILIANSNAAGSWDRHDQAPSNVSWSTNTFDYPGSITSATWNGSTVQVNRGGTGVTTSTGTGNNVLSNSPVLVTPDLGTPSAIVLTNASGTASININGTVGATTATTGQFTTGAFGGTQGTQQQLLIGGNSQTASTTEYGVNNQQTVQSAVTANYSGFQTILSTQATSFTAAQLTHYQAQQGTFGSGSTVTNQYGFRVSSVFTGAVNNYGFYGNIASATGVWNLYMAGTANNYLAGQTGINTTVTTNGFFTVGGSQSIAPAIAYIGGTNIYAGLISSLNLSTTLTGTAATTTMFGATITPVYNPAVGSTISAVYGLQNAPTLNSTITPTNWYGNITQLSFGASATGGTVTQIQAYGSVTPTFNASSTTGVTTYYGFNSGNITGTANNAIGTVYSFYANQASSNTGVTNNWNFYAAGTAPNFFNGDMRFNKTVTATGTTGAQTISKNAGTVNFAAAATSLVVTNTLVTTSSIIICTVGTNDTTMKSVQAVAAAGSFTLYPNAAPTAETRVNFIVIN